MCGIAGFVSLSPGTANPQTLDAMTGEIRHRGPDAGGFYRDEYAQLGHRRLSIIDLAAGVQPMSNEDGGLWIVYNGEIFNHADVRPRLESAGHIYKTRCDTETIIHAYEQDGPASLNHFRGMFSFALWDKNRRELFCARDRLGIKPFYYYWDERVFVFASEIKALLKHPAVSAQLDESLLPEYLAFGYTSGRTLFSGIRTLMPGHYLRLKLGGGKPSFETTQYWDVPEPRTESRSDAEWIRDCRERLEETVRLRLMSDVPLGMFLSGGLDSSAMAALMKRMVSSQIKTFAVGYQEAAFSELGFARDVAGHIGSDHKEVIVGMDDFFNALPDLVWHEDEPIAWPSSVSLAFVSQLAAREVKVVLTGEGSDELFGGYGRYKHHLGNETWARAYGIVPAPLRRLLKNNIEHSSLLSASLRRKLGHTVLGRDSSFEAMYLDNYYSAFSLDAQRELGPQLPGGSPYESYLHYFRRGNRPSTLSKLLYADQKTYLVELLMKQDQMSMSASIESRVPFLDHTFVEFASRVPDSLKIRGGEGKYILKRAVEDLLPRDIIYRTKMGFPTPLRQWLMDSRSEPLYSLLTSRDGVLGAFVDGNALRNLIQRHRSGVEDATDRIWRLLNFQLWGEIFLLGRRDRWREGLLAASLAPAR